MCKKRCFMCLRMPYALYTEIGLVCISICTYSIYKVVLKAEGVMQHLNGLGSKAGNFFKVTTSYQ